MSFFGPFSIRGARICFWVNQMIFNLIDTLSVTRACLGSKVIVCHAVRSLILVPKICLDCLISFGNKKPDNLDWVYIIEFYFLVT